MLLGWQLFMLALLLLLLAPNKPACGQSLLLLTPQQLLNSTRCGAISSASAAGSGPAAQGTASAGPPPPSLQLLCTLSDGIALRSGGVSPTPLPAASLWQGLSSELQTLDLRSLSGLFSVPPNGTLEIRGLSIVGAALPSAPFPLPASGFLALSAFRLGAGARLRLVDSFLTVPSCALLSLHQTYACGVSPSPNVTVTPGSLVVHRLTTPSLHATNVTVQCSGAAAPFPCLAASVRSGTELVQAAFAAQPLIAAIFVSFGVTEVPVYLFIAQDILLAEAADLHATLCRASRASSSDGAFGTTAGSNAAPVGPGVAATPAPTAATPPPTTAPKPPGPTVWAGCSAPLSYRLVLSGTPGAATVLDLTGTTSWLQPGARAGGLELLHLTLRGPPAGPGEAVPLGLMRLLLWTADFPRRNLGVQSRVFLVLENCMVELPAVEVAMWREAWGLPLGPRLQGTLCLQNEEAVLGTVIAEQVPGSEDDVMLVSAAGWAGAFRFSNVRLAVHEQHMQPPPGLPAAGGAAAAAAAAGGVSSSTGTSPNTRTNAGGVGDGGDASTSATRTSALGAPPAAAGDFSSFLQQQNLAAPGSYPDLCVIVPPGAQLPVSSRSYRRVTTGILLGIDLLSITLSITAGVDNSSSDSERVELEQAYFGNLVESYSRGASMRLDTRDVVGMIRVFAPVMLMGDFYDAAELDMDGRVAAISITGPVSGLFTLRLIVLTGLPRACCGAADDLMSLPALASAAGGTGSSVSVGVTQGLAPALANFTSCLWTFAFDRSPEALAADVAGGAGGRPAGLPRLFLDSVVLVVPEAELQLLGRVWAASADLLSGRLAFSADTDPGLAAALREMLEGSQLGAANGSSTGGSTSSGSWTSLQFSTLQWCGYVGRNVTLTSQGYSASAAASLRRVAATWPSLAGLPVVQVAVPEPPAPPVRVQPSTPPGQQLPAASFPSGTTAFPAPGPTAGSLPATAAVQPPPGGAAAGTAGSPGVPGRSAAPPPQPGPGLRQPDVALVADAVSGDLTGGTSNGSSVGGGSGNSGGSSSTSGGGSSSKPVPVVVPVVAAVVGATLVLCAAAAVWAWRRRRAQLHLAAGSPRKGRPGQADTSSRTRMPRSTASSYAGTDADRAATSGDDSGPTVKNSSAEGSAVASSPDRRGARQPRSLLQSRSSAWALITGRGVRSPPRRSPASTASGFVNGVMQRVSCGVAPRTASGTGSTGAGASGAASGAASSAGAGAGRNPPDPSVQDSVRKAIIGMFMDMEETQAAGEVAAGGDGGPPTQVVGPATDAAGSGTPGSRTPAEHTPALRPLSKTADGSLQPNRAVNTRTSDGAGSAMPQQPSPPPVLAIIGELGRGAQGVVYRGVWRGLDVAVKSVLFHLEPGPGGAARDVTVQRAVQEAAIAVSMAHPNIVATYTYQLQPLQAQAPNAYSEQGIRLGDGSLSGPAVEFTGSSSGSSANPGHAAEAAVWKLTLIQELCDANSLRHCLQSGLLLLGQQAGAGVGTGSDAGQSPALQPLPARTVLLLACDVARGLAHLHERGVVHADLSSNNVLLQSTAGRPPRMSAPGTTGSGPPAPNSSAVDTGLGVVAKLGDFGLSGRLDVEANATHLSGPARRSSAYSAPELVAYGRSGPAGDVYAFAVVLWELALGLPLPVALARPESAGLRAWQSEQARLVPLGDDDFNASGTGGQASDVGLASLALPPGLFWWPPGTPAGLVSLVAECLRPEPRSRPPAAAVLQRLQLVQTAEKQRLALPCTTGYTHAS